MAFLADLDLRPLPADYAGDIAFEPLGYTFGAGSYALEVVVVEARRPPTAGNLRAAWKKRAGGRPSPILIVALHAGGAAATICGPQPHEFTQNPPVYPPMRAEKAERICRAALALDDRNAALTLLRETLPEAGDKILGVLNQGLLATHELEVGVTRRLDWHEAVKRGGEIRRERKRALLQKLGFTLRGGRRGTWVLHDGDKARAIALVLNRGEQPNSRSQRFSQRAPIDAALARADQDELPYVIAASDDAIRLYPAGAGVGVGQRGRSETFIQLRLDLLSAEEIGYLWLLFSAEALRPEGAFSQILADSHQYASELGARLRNRIYEDVIPGLAESIAEARGMTQPDRVQLDETYQMALTVLFRLLFIAYAEDKNLLPYRSNDEYQSYSLNLLAQRLLARERRLTPFDDAPLMWNRVADLFAAIDRGHHGLGVPPYNGGLFESEAEKSPVGAAIKEISLSDSDFGPILSKLLIDETRDGQPGPVDFRSLSVREFGTIYEGLLQSELSLAQTDLGLGADGLYIPETREKRIVVRAGEIYLHNASGKRKASGSYYTKSFAVEHLLDHALEPALDDHLARLQDLGERASSDDFFDFRVADIAMGSGHFLVAAIDRIEKRFSTWLATHPLPEVSNELARLRENAAAILREYGEKQAIDEGQLLRRQIARRCVYGVDLNPLAVELARLSIWVHTFVPGLPLSLLDYNLARGNSLVGIATIQEAQEALDQAGQTLFSANAQDLLGAADEQLTRIRQLADADSAEVSEATRAHEKARELLAPSEALFDILAASRLNDELRQSIAMGITAAGESARQGLPGSQLHKLALETLRATPPFHFPIAFPQVFLRQRAGFDVILGNPPWEGVKLDENRFWTRYVPGLQGLEQRVQEEVKADWREHRPDIFEQYKNELAATDLVRKVLLTGPFPGMGTGNPDLYKGFVWRFWALLSEGIGRAGVVLPRSVFQTAGAADFRKAVFRSGSVVDLTNLVNHQQWVFDEVAGKYTITLFTIQKLRPHEATTLPMRGPYMRLLEYLSDRQHDSPRFSMRDVFRWTPSAALPLLPGSSSGSTFTQIRESPSLDVCEGDKWMARLYRELDSTNDKKYMEFTNEPERGWWPVYKGSSFSIWEPDTGRHYGWSKPDKVLKRLVAKRKRANRNRRSAFYGFSEEWANDSATYPAFRPRIACRKITRATDRRTTFAALIPPDVVVQDGVTLFIFPRGDECDEAYLLGLLSSIPTDWYSRRFVEINMNFHILNALPIPRPARDNPLWQRVVALAGRLAAVDARYAEWAAAVGVDYGRLEPAVKDDMIHELDAVVAHLYGLDAAQLAHIFKTFHVGWDYQPRLAAVLAHYHDWEGRL